MDNLQTQIENLRTLQESYDAVAQAAEAYNVGKVQLAQAITSKGVETSPTESYPEMAEKVLDIQQETIEITAPNWYGSQIGADGALWDLYQVLAQMKNQWLGADRYAALIVCEYYKGYDSLQLQGADAYYTCDGDFYDTSSPLHTWHDSDNGKMNRWVCFLYRTEGARLDITNSAISPRSMYIGGHIGTIEYFVDGRLTDLVCGVEETDILDNFNQNGFAQSFASHTTLKFKNATGLTLPDGVFNYIKAESLITTNRNCIYSTAQYIYVDAEQTITIQGAYSHFIQTSKGGSANTVGVMVNGIIKCGYGHAILAPYDVVLTSSGSLPNLRFLYCEGYTPTSNAAEPFITGMGGSTSQLEDVLVGNHFIYNLNCRAWNPTSVLADTDKKSKMISNIKNHILEKINDRTGESQLSFIISTNMYNNIASEQIEWQGETMSLADAFLTKNWLLAGA